MSRINYKRIVIIALVTTAICTAIFMCLFFTPAPKTMPSWTETRAGAVEIGKMLCKYAEVKGKEGYYPPSWQELLKVNKLDMGVDDLFEEYYFKKECYSWEVSYDESLNPPVRFKITFTVPEDCEVKHMRRYKKTTYDHKGTFEMFEFQRSSFFYKLICPFLASGRNTG